MKDLLKKYRVIIELLKRLYGNFYLIGLDAEWHEVVDGINNVLTSQLATVSPESSASTMIVMAHGERKTLAELVEVGIRLAHGGKLPRFEVGRRHKVLLVAHYTVAEWSALADRDAPYIIENLTCIRKTVVTGDKPITCVLSDHSLADVQIFDTKLLAPASHQSLDKLSSLLGDSNEQKIDLSQFYKENMHLLLRDDPDLFERYAIRDAELCVELFFLLQKTLNQLAGSKKKKLYRTLASAAVDGFSRKHRWYSRYRRALKKKKFWSANRLAERAYHGGRNESYFVGRTQDHLPLMVYVDVDFCACYPSVMALCPRIDVDGEVIFRPVRYRIDEETIARLERENIPPKNIQGAQAALETSLEAFEAFLKKQPGKLSYQLRQLTRVIDNSLIDSWQQRVKDAQINGSDAVECALIAGFALVIFEFPEGTLYPCLPVRHRYYGLVYPLKGETYATAAEILLALEMGAKVEAITSVEYPVVLDEHGKPDLFLQPHLKDLLKKRAEFEEAEEQGDATAAPLAKLCKEFVNSFYGKFAQGVNPRTTVQVGDGLSQVLGPSRITQSIIAALITGGARATLSALVLAANVFNDGRRPEEQIVPISATTDGALLGLPAPADYSVVDEYFTWGESAGQKVPKFVGSKSARVEAVFERFGCQDYFTILNSYLPIRQLISARQALTGDATYLEIKHMADEIDSLKTRFQIGHLSTGHCSLIAKGGLRPPLSELYENPEDYKSVMTEGGVVKNTREAQWIIDNIDQLEITRGELCDYDFITLSGFKEILTGQSSDLTRQVSKRVFHADYDWKRLQFYQDGPAAAGGKSISPFTVPHQSMAAMKKYRGVAQGIRKGGESASAEKVLARVQQQDRRVWMRGGADQALTRMFLRGVLQGLIPVSSSELSYNEMAEIINEVFTELEVK